MIMANILLQIILFVTLACLISAVEGSESPENVGNGEHRLLNHLMGKYRQINPEGSIRPRLNHTDGLSLRFGLSLIRFDYLDRGRDLGEFHFWEIYEWTDEFMTWNPDDFGGVGQIRVPMRAPIWLPDWTLFTGPFEQNSAYDIDDLGLVSSDGRILYVARSKRKVICDIFPWQTEFTCTLKFGSWTHDGFKLDPEFYNDLKGIAVDDYILDNRYELVKTGAWKNVKHYPCCQEPYPDLTFTMQFNATSRIIL